MITIPVKTRLQPNGSLNLHVPTGLPESDVEVVIIVQPVHSAPAVWPEGFFEQTSGAFAEHPLERGEQGFPEQREILR